MLHECKSQFQDVQVRLEADWALSAAHSLILLATLLCPRDSGL